MTVSKEQGTGKFEVSKSRLEGKVEISGAKNSVLKLLAASLLTSERVTIQNFPSELLDVKVHLGMLEALGKKCEIVDGHAVIDEPAGIAHDLDWDDRSIRNTLLILGILTARTGHASVPLPGGCKLGERNYDLHQMVLESLGAKVMLDGDTLRATADKGLVGNDIHLPIRSTGATENAILAGCLARGTTRIWNPHVRPEILDLIALLRSMGAKITVRGQESIEVNGVAELGGARHTAIPDNIEAITWLVGSVVTNGDVEIENFPFRDLEVPLIQLRESGAKFYRNEGSMIVKGGECYPIEISTGPYPGINSDMQPLFALYGARARGISKVVDLRFPGRYQYAKEFEKLGITTEVDGNILSIHGAEKLVGTQVTALDLRAGIALVLAGFCADGTTTIDQAWQIERGYNDFVRKARSLNGNISALN